MGIDYAKRLREQLGSLTTMRASEAKNQFGQALDSALSGRAVLITKHDTPKAILISIEEFEAMTMRQRKLNALSAEFDAMYERMQTPESAAVLAIAKRRWDQAREALQRADGETGSADQEPLRAVDQFGTTVGCVETRE